jgi:glycosyltransferase involved in cell wall biosynthesis
MPVLTPESSGQRVSVIIPTYNGAEWIAQAVESVLSQTRAASEVIVVDDGSTDDTRERLEPFMGRIRYERQENQGVAAARNRGLTLATSELIAFLDADDAWHPRKLELQVAAMGSGVGVLGTRTFAWPAMALPESKAGGVTKIGRERLAVKNYLTTSSVLMRAEVARAVGEFDRTLHGPEDHDYWLRAAEVGGVGILESPLTGYREVPGSLSRRAVSMEAGMRRILLKLDGRDFWRGDRMLRRRAYGYVAYACAFLHGADGDNRTALSRVFESLAWYPLPLARSEAGTVCVRLRRVVVLLLRCLGVRRAA